MKSLVSGLFFCVVVFVAFMLFVGLFTGECSNSKSTTSTTQSKIKKVQSPISVNTFTNRLGDQIKVGDFCFTNGADRNATPPATLMNLSLYEESILNKRASQMISAGKIPHGKKVKVIKIEKFKGKGFAQIKWKSKYGWMSINLLSPKYQKPVGDRF